MWRLRGEEEVRAVGVNYWQERAPGTRLINEYGPTETVVGCCVYEVNGVESGREVVPIGKPIANAQIDVLDRGLEPAPIGARGEIYVSGAGVARGYVSRAELTGEKFVPNRFGRNGGERVYRTGDLGRYLPDGKIEFIGRGDHQVKVRGYRIELGEIEAVLNEHRSVKQSVVVAREDENGGKRLLGYVVGEGGVTAAELKSYVRERLPEYMVPEAIMILEEMPLTANGKVDRKRLPEVKDGGRQSEQEYAGARTPVEEIVIGIFEEVLKAEGVGRKDDFFEIGGHSLLATQVVSRVRKVFGVEIGVVSIFEDGTVEGLAQRIEEVKSEGRLEEAPPLVRALRNERLPLSFAQQRLWFIDQLEPGGAMYNVPTALRVRGELRRELLGSALGEVVRRHEALRTRFEVREGQPIQVIDEVSPIEMPLIDVSGLEERQREKEARKIAGEEAARSFDLNRGPLLRVIVLKMDEEEHVLLYTTHHIVSDGWSMEILIREVGELYRAFSAGEPSPLEELPIQYADFAVWQREWLGGEVLERQMEYWGGQLKDLQILELPTDHPRPTIQSFRGSRCRFQVDGELSQRLQELSRAEGATLFITLLAAFQALLGRYTGEQDITVGTVIANRNHLETEGLIGFFVNQLVMRTDLSEALSFRRLLGKVRRIVLESYSHQDLPFEQLVEELAPKRDLSRPPLCQVVFALQNTPQAGLGLPGLSLTGFEVESRVAKWDLTLVMNKTPEALIGFWEYCQDLFEEQTVLRMIGHFQMLLRSAVSDPECRLSELEILTEGEREQILVEQNKTESDYSLQHCAHELFEVQAMLTPEAVAVVYEGHELSYGELNRRANQLAHYLKRWGVSPEMVVGLYLERSLEMLIGLLGVLKAGGAYLPLNRSYPLERLAYMLADSQVPILLSQSKAAEHLPVTEAQVICLDSDWDEIAQEQDGNLAASVRGENLAYVIYTSGSTGQPKGVMVGHKGLCNLVKQQLSAFGVRPQNRVLQFASLSFDASVFESFMALGSGAILCLADEERLRPGTELCEMLRRDAIDVVTLPPVVLSTLEAAAVSGVRKVISAGEECSNQVVEKWARDRRFFNAYGPTEVTVWVTLAEW